MQVLVIGASRGIGLEFVRQYRADGISVLATARDGSGLTRLNELGAIGIALDVEDPVSVASMRRNIEGLTFDIVVLCAGVYGPRTSGLEAPQQVDFDVVMRTNVLGPMRVLSQLLTSLNPGAKVALLTSRMGSMELRDSTNGWLYRASKAAANSILKDTSIAFAGSAICIAFHPGWVRTEMGGVGADLSVEEAVAGMRATLAEADLAYNGRFLNFDGQPLAW